MSAADSIVCPRPRACGFAYPTTRCPWRRAGWFANAYLHEAAQQQPWPSAAGGGGGGRERLCVGGADERRESVEWLYAFDVHCNAFLPIYLLLYVAQYLLLPLLLRAGVLPAFLSNGLFASAFSAYHYLTFLGYSEMPFLQRCEVFVYPIALVLLALVLSLPLGVNGTATVVYMYFAK